MHDPLEQSGSRDLVPPQRIHFFDGIRPTRPYVYGLNRVRNPETFQVEYKADESEKLAIQLFPRGHEYKLLGLFPTSRHLIGLEGNADALYILGTDRLGRDMFSRLMHGTRLSMSIGLVGVTISLILGVLLGGISGYRGGVADMAIQRLIEFLRSIPTIPLWLALSAAVPKDWSIDTGILRHYRSSSRSSGGRPWPGRSAAASCPCGRKTSSWPPGSTGPASSGSSSVTCCRRS